MPARLKRHHAAPALILTAIAALVIWLNWWKVSFRHARVVGLSESALIARHGQPDYDTRATTLRGDQRPATEQERLQLGRDDDHAYDLIWITGIGTTHARVHFANGTATGVTRGEHR